IIFIYSSPPEKYELLKTREYQGLQQDGRGGLQPRLQSSIMKKLFSRAKRPELDPVPPVDESKR
ncbi:hypothetical protein, partial [Faecalibaculum rodentium]|uniref:hypothetical protein n=1 Tax=Faecalibaculum rodentium TaxID=1702221 RepID=UPI00272A017F